MPDWYYHDVMETIIFKVPDGTKEKLKGINPNVSELLREQVEALIRTHGSGSALDKARHLCGIFKGGARDLSTTRDYLKRYGKRDHR
jgi:hypothetical protein